MNIPGSSQTDAASSLLRRYFGSATNGILVVSVPGRVNLIGEHIDYHLLPVLPMAIHRRVTVAFRTNNLSSVRAISSNRSSPVFISLGDQTPSAEGDWSNYIKAAVSAVRQRWPIRVGLDAGVVSDLPMAAGLSSSSALMAAFALALLQANDVQPTLNELMEVLPEGEQFVGTRGGSMDHAAVLAGRPECAFYIQFAPCIVTPVAVPKNWEFLVAHSLKVAEKSGAVRENYNALRVAGLAALHAHDFDSFRGAMRDWPFASPFIEPVYRHVIEEALRVEAARRALVNDHMTEFGKLLLKSHASMRDCLGISTDGLDKLVALAIASGAAGARLTGAGFGGCVVALCHAAQTETVLAGMGAYYADNCDFRPDEHLFGLRQEPCSYE